MRGLDLVAVSSEVLIDEELVRIDAVDPIAGTLILARGCVDTVPAPHAEGARIWCTESYVGADPTEHLAGESIEAKLLTRTQQGTLSAGPAADQRQRRAAAEFPRLSIAWAHRDRVLQGDRLIEHEAGGIGPEPGATTRVRVLHALSGALLHEAVDIAGTDLIYDLALANDATIHIEVQSQRGAFASRQSHVCVIATRVRREAGECRL